MAKSLTLKEIDVAFDEIKNSLTGINGYDAEKLTPLTSTYKDAVVKLHNSLYE